MQKGDKVFGFDSANKAIGTLILCFDDEDSMEKVMNDISRFVKVKTE